MEGLHLGTCLPTDRKPLVEELDQESTTGDMECPDGMGMAIPINLGDSCFGELKSFPNVLE
jgi:hypothetical protein